MGRFWELIFLLAGVIVLCLGLAHHSIALVILGLVLLAIGGVIVYYVHFHDDRSSGGGGGGGGDWDFF